MIPFPPFIQKWGLSIALGLAITGFAAGFWLYISDLNDDLKDAEAAVSRLESEVSGLEEQAKSDAELLADLRARLDVEHKLSQERLETESERRQAAEDRNRSFAGAIDALRRSLAETGAACGIGQPLSDGLRDARASREAERTAREGRGQ
jgi:chromosome segregation ATPase